MASKSFKIESLPEWCRSVDSDPDERWIIPGFIPYDALVLLSGAPKRWGQKTWFAMLLSWAANSGESVCNGLLAPAGPGVPVLYVYAEGARKPTRERFDLLQVNFGRPHLNLDKFYVAHRQKLELEERDSVFQILDFIKENGVKLVVIDTLAKSMTGDENDAQSMGRVVKGLESIRSAGASVLLLHHTRKGDVSQRGGEPDPDGDLRGSGALAGAYESHLAVRQYGYNKRAHDLIVTHKDGESAAFKMRWTIKGMKDDAPRAHLELKPSKIDEITLLGKEDIDELVAPLAEGQMYTVDMLAAAWRVPKTTAQDFLVQMLEGELLTTDRYGYKLT